MKNYFVEKKGEQLGVFNDCADADRELNSACEEVFESDGQSCYYTAYNADCVYCNVKKFSTKEEALEYFKNIKLDTLKIVRTDDDDFEFDNDNDIRDNYTIYECEVDEDFEDDEYFYGNVLNSKCDNIILDESEYVANLEEDDDSEEDY